jgi:hypothetical protein
MFSQPTALAEMRRNARLEFEAKYTGQANHAQLMFAYGRAIENANRHRRSPAVNELVAWTASQTVPSRRRSVSLRIADSNLRLDHVSGGRESDSLSDLA